MLAHYSLNILENIDLWVILLCWFRSCAAWVISPHTSYTFLDFCYDELPCQLKSHFQTRAMDLASKSHLLPGIDPQINSKLKKKYCSHARARLRKRWRKSKPSFPLNLKGNVKSLANKMDELGVLLSKQQQYRVCSIMCFRHCFRSIYWTPNTCTHPLHNIVINQWSLFRGFLSSAATKTL